MGQLVGELFYRHFGNEVLLRSEDAAVLELSGPVAFTTDAFTVTPLVFPGGDIGKLAIAGTVNDLAMMGARPLYLSCGFILEEGLEIEVLESVVASMAAELAATGAKIVCGDTKVVPRGSADRLFITTSGIGEIVCSGLSASSIRAGDVILVSRDIGCHGAAILGVREEIDLRSTLQSDCASLWPAVEALIGSGVQLRAMRDATRGGLSAVLNEWARQSDVGIEIDEAAIPVSDEVRGLCELLGFEPTDLANEGTFTVAVAAADAQTSLAVLQRFHPEAAVIGTVGTERIGRVVLRSPWGSRRYLDLPKGELLPRIC